MQRGIIKSLVFLLIAGFFLGLAGCGRQSPDFHLTDVTGHMPDLRLFGVKNAHGQVRSAADYRGKIVVLYFGYTHCPDVCPLTLAKLHQVLQRLGPKAKNVEVLFATVDPKRDTPAVLRRYVTAFDPRFHALRPTGETLDSLTHRYHAAYSYGQPDAEGNYVVSHSAGIFIFDGTGKIRLIGTSGADTAAAMATDIEKLRDTDSSWWSWW